MLKAKSYKFLGEYAFSWLLIICLVYQNCSWVLLRHLPFIHDSRTEKKTGRYLENEKKEWKSFFVKSVFNPIKGDVSDSQLNAGEPFWPPSGTLWKSAVRPHIAKCYFETYNIYDHMQSSYQKNSLRYWDLNIFR